MYYDDKRQEPKVRDVLPMLSRPFMPDNGMQMDPERMAEAGYTWEKGKLHYPA